MEANLERSFSDESVYKDSVRERAIFGKATTESAMFAELKMQVLVAAKLDYNPSLRNPRSKEQRDFFH